jgi:hypothetical protein
MIAHAALLLDERRDPLGGPQRGRVPDRLGPALQRTLEAPELGGGEPGFASGAARILEGAASAPRQLSGPATHRLPMDAERTCDVRLRHVLAQQRDRREPPRFERREIPFPAGWMSHAPKIPSCLPFVTILYGPQ